MENIMKCTKILTLATLALAATLSVNVQAADNLNAKVQSLHKAENPNKVIVDTLFANASPAEKARLQEQIKKYSQVQYGFETANANPSPVKDADVLNNIKSHNPETVKSQMKVMREAAQEVPKLEQIQTKKIKP